MNGGVCDFFPVKSLDIDLSGFCNAKIVFLSIAKNTVPVCLVNFQINAMIFFCLLYYLFNLFLGRILDKQRISIPIQNLNSCGFAFFNGLQNGMPSNCSCCLGCRKKIQTGIFLRPLRHSLHSELP